MNSLKDAVRLLEQGDWKAAHKIVQNLSSPAAHWAHAIVHMMEGDRDNADYWYGKAQRARPEPFIGSQEIARLSWLADAASDGRSEC
ncbi:MAG: hypothetical protein OXE83_09050 [Gammaproteobacteria bacterium]|nr:hypothetical protein [Gammaproteobacteria bacterium]